MASQIVDLEELADLLEQKHALTPEAIFPPILVPMSTIEMLQLVQILNDVCFRKKRVLRAGPAALACRLGTKIEARITAALLPGIH